MRWSVCLAVAGAAAGCYSPSPRVGAPCSTSGACPSGQHCDTTVEPPTCALADARPIDAPPDAPPTCTTSTDCDAATPYCDVTTSFCRGCRADAECGTDVCLEHDGTCHNASNSLFIGPAGTGSQCTLSAPCTYASAIGQIANNKRVIVVLDGTYTNQFAVPSSHSANSLTLSGIDADAAGAIVTPATSPALYVAATSKELVVEGITFRSSPGIGIDNRGATVLSRIAVEVSGGDGIVSSSSSSLAIRDSIIENSSSVGVAVSAGTIEIVRTHVVDNAGGGIDIRSAGFTIESSIIANNGSALSPSGGVRFAMLDGETPQIFAFNTLANNVSAIGLDGVQCPSALMLDSSIIADGVLGCTPTYSLLPPVDPLFVAPGDYHLTVASPAIDMANPVATTLTDIDGDPRPLGAGRDIGADEYAP